MQSTRGRVWVAGVRWELRFRCFIGTSGAGCALGRELCRCTRCVSRRRRNKVGGRKRACSSGRMRRLSRCVLVSWRRFVRVQVALSAGGTMQRRGLLVREGLTSSTTIDAVLCCACNALLLLATSRLEGRGTAGKLLGGEDL